MTIFQFQLLISKYLDYLICEIGSSYSSFTKKKHINFDIHINVSNGIPDTLHNRELQKATQNFTTTLGEGSFGTVYKATMPTGEVIAVKVLAHNSKQGEREFQTEVLANIYYNTWFVGHSIYL